MIDDYLNILLLKKQLIHLNDIASPFQVHMIYLVNQFLINMLGVIFYHQKSSSH